MDKDWYYKNFNMVAELDIAGEFIYNGISELNRMDVIRNNAPTFYALYALAVGIERLQKIVLVLWKYDKIEDKQAFEKSLITHSHSDLRDEIKKYTGGSKNAILNARENDFITLIQKFYTTARYERFNINGQNDIEIELWNVYIKKYIEDVSIDFLDKGIILDNKIKEFLGRVVGSISKKYYQLIREGSNKNNTFTYELRTDSKAEKVFLGEYRHKSLIEEKINERIAFKELLVYLRNSKEKSAFLKYLDGIKPLEFDPPMVMDYIKEIAEGIIPQTLIDEVENMYVENEYKFERVQLVDLMGDPWVRFDYPDVCECNKILSGIVEKKIIEKSMIDCLNDHANFIEEDEIREVLENVNTAYIQYQEGKITFEILMKKMEECRAEFQEFIFTNWDENND